MTTSSSSTDSLHIQEDIAKHNQQAARRYFFKGSPAAILLVFALTLPIFATTNKLSSGQPPSQEIAFETLDQNLPESSENESENHLIDELKTATNEKSLLEAELESLKKGNRLLQQSLAELLEELQTLRTYEWQARKENNHDQDLIALLKNELLDSQSLLEAYQHVIEEKEKSLSDHDKAYQALVQRLQENSGEQAAYMAKNKLLNDETKQKLETLSSQYESVLNEKTLLEQNIKDLNESFSSYRDEKESELIATNNSFEELNQDYQNIKQILSEAVLEKEEHLESIACLETTIKEKDKSLDEALLAQEKLKDSFCNEINTIYEERNQIELALDSKEDEILALEAEFQQVTKLNDELTDLYEQNQHKLNQALDDSEKIAAGLRKKLHEEAESYQVKFMEKEQSQKKLHQELTEKTLYAEQLENQLGMNEQDLIALENSIEHIQIQKKQLQDNFDEKLTELQQLEADYLVVQQEALLEKQQMNETIDQLTRQYAEKEEVQEQLTSLLDENEEKLILSLSTVHQLEEQISSLKEIENDYYSLKDDFINQHQRLRETIDYQNQIIVESNNNLENGKREKLELSELIASLQEQIEGLEQNLAASQENHSHLIQSTEDHKAIANGLTNKIYEQGLENQKLLNEITTLQDTLEEKQLCLIAIQEEHEEFIKENESNHLVIANLNEKSREDEKEKQNLISQLTMLQTTLNDKEELIAANDHQYQSNLTNLNERIHKLELNNHTLSDEIITFQDALEERQLELIAYQEEYKGLINEVEGNHLDIAKLNEKNREDNKEKQNLISQLAMLQITLNDKEELIAANDHQHQSILTNLNEMIYKHELENQTMAEQLATLQTELNEKQQNLVASNEDRNKALQNLMTYKESLEKMSGEVASLREIEQQYKNFKNEALAEQNNLAQALGGAKSNLAVLEKKNEQLMSSLGEKQQTLLSSETDLLDLKEMFNEIKEDNQIKTARLTQLEDEYANTRKLLRQLRKSQESKVAGYEQEIDELNEKLVKTENENSAMIATLKKISNDHDCITKMLEEQKNQYNILTQNQTGEKARYEQKIQSLSNKLSALTEDLVIATDSRNNVEYSMKQTIEDLSQEKKDMRNTLKRVALQLKNVKDSYKREKQIWQKKEMLIKKMQRHMDEQRKLFEANS